MIVLFVLAAVFGLAALGLGVWWLCLVLAERRRQRAAADAAIDAFLRQEFRGLAREVESALARDFGPRRAREIHGMSASEIASTREDFEELIRASWPDLP